MNTVMLKRWLVDLRNDPKALAHFRTFYRSNGAHPGRFWISIRHAYATRCDGCTESGLGALAGLAGRENEVFFKGMQVVAEAAAVTLAGAQPPRPSNSTAKEIESLVVEIIKLVSPLGSGGQTQ